MFFFFQSSFQSNKTRSTFSRSKLRITLYIPLPSAHRELQAGIRIESLSLCQGSTAHLLFLKTPTKTFHRMTSRSVRKPLETQILVPNRICRADG